MTDHTGMSGEDMFGPHGPRNHDEEIANARAVQEAMVAAFKSWWAKAAIKDDCSPYTAAYLGFMAGAVYGAREVSK